jgi:ATP synthase protein I
VLRARTQTANRKLAIDKKTVQIIGTYSYVGIFFGVAVCLGLLGGRWLDRRIHTEPWFTLVGVVLGVAAGFRELYRLSKKALKEEER